MAQHQTAFYWNERCFWHGAGNFSFLLPVGGLVEPMSTGFLPEAPETKRRMKNLIDVTGLMRQLDEIENAPSASEEQLLAVHPKHYLDEFRRLSSEQGGNLGLRTPFGPGGFDIASLSTGLVTSALFSVLDGKHKNAYALSRPPGHHCLPDYPNGFCLLIILVLRYVPPKPRKRPNVSPLLTGMCIMVMAQNIFFMKIKMC